MGKRLILNQGIHINIQESDDEMCSEVRNTRYARQQERWSEGGKKKQMRDEMRESSEEAGNPVELSDLHFV